MHVLNERSSLILVIDVGVNKIKAAIATINGIVLDAKTDQVPIDIDSGSMVEGAPLISRITTVIKRLDQELRERVAVVVPSTIPSTFFVDDSGRPIGKGITYNDPRGAEFLDKLREEKEMSWWLNRIGNVPNMLSSLHRFNVLSEEQDISNATYFGSIATLIGAYLTGEVAINTVEALEWGLLNIKSKKWDTKVLSLVDIIPSMLPRLVEPHEVVGYLKKDISKELGLPEGTPVAGGAVDFVLATLGAGAHETGDIYMAHGTSSWIGVVSDIPTPSPNLFLDYHVLPGKYIINGCVAMTGEIIKRFANEMNIHLEERWINMPYIPSGVVILPFFSGERTPFNDPFLKAAVIGLSLDTSRIELLKSMMESIAFLSRLHVEEFRKMGIYPVRYIASGGLMRIFGFAEILASVLGAELWTLSYDATLRGAAQLGGMILGIKDIPANDREYWVVSPIPRLEKELKPYYSMFVELVPALRPFLHKLSTNKSANLQ